jgi:hypothetical protein
VAAALPDDLKRRFAAEAAQSEKEALSGGKTYALAAAFDYLEGRVAGKKARRPRHALGARRTNRAAGRPEPGGLAVNDRKSARI